MSERQVIKLEPPLVLTYDCEKMSCEKYPFVLNSS